MRKLFPFILIMTLILIYACNKENPYVDDQIPDEIVGTWVYEWPESNGAILFIWKFENPSKNIGLYQFSWIVNDPAPGVQGMTTIASHKGDRAIEDNKMQTYIQFWGSQQEAPMSEIFYDTIKWYAPDDPGFLLFGDGLLAHEAAYKFGESKDFLCINEDENGNGIFEEEEYLIYYKQN